MPEGIFDHRMCYPYHTETAYAMHYYNKAFMSNSRMALSSIQLKNHRILCDLCNIGLLRSHILLAFGIIHIKFPRQSKIVILRPLKPSP